MESHLVKSMKPYGTHREPPGGHIIVTNPEPSHFSQGQGQFRRIAEVEAYIRYVAQGPFPEVN